MKDYIFLERRSFITYLYINIYQKKYRRHIIDIVVNFPFPAVFIRCVPTSDSHSL